MKRSFIRALLVGAALAVGASAFAQLSFNGYYRVGAVANDDTNGNWTTGFADRVRLNLSYAASDDMYGVKARLQQDSAFGATTSAFATVFGTPKYAMAYVKLLDGTIKVSAGILDVTDYAVAQTVANPYFGNVYTDDYAPNTPLLSGQKGKTQGMIVQVWPIEGLSIAGVARVDGSSTAPHHLGLDAYYLIPGVGKVLVNSQLGYYSATAVSASDDLSKSYFSGGFSYTGFKGLTASAVYRYYASSAAATGASGAVAIVEYVSGPLYADLASDMDFTNAKAYTEAEVSYLIIPQIKVRAYGAYNSAGAFTNLITANLGSSQVNNNQYLAGADVVFPVGKSELAVGMNYGDKSNVSFPLIIKANF